MCCQLMLPRQSVISIAAWRWQDWCWCGRPPSIISGRSLSEAGSPTQSDPISRSLRVSLELRWDSIHGGCWIRKASSLYLGRRRWKQVSRISCHVFLSSAFEPSMHALPAIVGLCAWILAVSRLVTGYTIMNCEVFPVFQIREGLVLARDPKAKTCPPRRDSRNPQARIIINNRMVCTSVLMIDVQLMCA